MVSLATISFKLDDFETIPHNFTEAQKYNCIQNTMYVWVAVDTKSVAKLSLHVKGVGNSSEITSKLPFREK